MFENVGWVELLIIVVAGLFILGPERLPQGAAWLGRTVRQIKEYATGAREQLRSELGPEFDDLRKPLEDLRGIRGLNPRNAVTQHLFNGDDPVSDLSNGNGYKPPQTPPRQRPLAPGERPPYDPDTT